MSRKGIDKWLTRGIAAPPPKDQKEVSRRSIFIGIEYFKPKSEDGPRFPPVNAPSDEKNRGLFKRLRDKATALDAALRVRDAVPQDGAGKIQEELTRVRKLLEINDQTWSSTWEAAVRADAALRDAGDVNQKAEAIEKALAEVCELLKIPKEPCSLPRVLVGLQPGDAGRLQLAAHLLVEKAATEVGAALNNAKENWLLPPEDGIRTFKKEFNAEVQRADIVWKGEHIKNCIWCTRGGDAG